MNSPPATSTRPRTARHGQPHAGAENAGLDGVADQEQAAQRQRDAADPDRPARAERRFDIGLAGGFRRRGRRSAGSAAARRRLACAHGPDTTSPVAASASVAGACAATASLDRWRSHVGSCRNGRSRIGRLAVGRRLLGRLDRRRHGARKHEAAQRAKLALDQADAALLARNDDEQRDDGDKADQAFKHGGSPKPGQFSLTLSH